MDYYLISIILVIVLVGGGAIARQNYAVKRLGEIAEEVKRETKFYQACREYGITEEDVEFENITEDCAKKLREVASELDAHFERATVEELREMYKRQALRYHGHWKD